jgi:hypothetical protein
MFHGLDFSNEKGDMLPVERSQKTASQLKLCFTN